MTTNLLELLEEQARRFPENEAVVSVGKETKRRPYKDLRDDVYRLGAALLAAGAGPSRIGILLPNSIEYVVGFYAATSIGAIAVPLHIGLQSSEIFRFLTDNQITHLLAARDAAPKVQELRDLGYGPLSVIWADASGFELRGVASTANGEPFPRSLDRSTPAFSLHSSGSTGLPKRVTRTHGQTLVELEGIRRALAFEPSDRFLGVAPFCHHYGLFNSMLSALAAGGTLVISDELSPRDVIRVIEEERITSFPGVPYLLRMMCEVPALAGADLSSLRYCFSATAPLPESVRLEFARIFSVHVRQLYGSTEVGVTTVDLGEADAEIGARVGRPIGGVDLAIMDAEGQPLGPGVEGDISVRAEWAVEAYDLPGSNGDAFFRDGRFHAGDRGFVDDTGRLTLTGRTRRFINVAGHKVDPSEVEAALQEHPSVREVVVVGVPDEFRGEIIEAVVVGAQARDRSVLVEHCRARLAEYKRPHIIELRTEIPRSPVGKILRRLLVDPPADAAASESSPRTTSDSPHDSPSAHGAAELRPLVDAVCKEVARILALDRDVITADRPLKELGLGSLRAVELSKAIAHRFGIAVPAVLAFDHPTPRAIALYVHRTLAPVNRTKRQRAPSNAEPIAIVGIGCRFPGGVTSPDTFWKGLVDGVDAVGEMPRDRWNVDALYDPDPDAIGKTITRRGGFMEAVDRFDADFFGISPREAKNMDPQQRLLLETSWEALEHAGIVPLELAGTDTGVFVGSMYQEYATLGGDSLERRDGYVATGTMASVASGRISYLLGLQGPSLTLDTACSSSLVAVHLACQSLRKEECSLALAGGVTLMLTPGPFVEFSRLRGLAPDGRCKTFSANADGVGWSEGAGVLVLERLSTARRLGHSILGLIRGSAVNQDGRSSGLTVPNGPAQAAVIERAMWEASVASADVQYVECHGTGTTLGDPIEVTALGGVLADRGESGRSVLIGSVKTNIGHTQAAAGVAGIIKTLLAFEHEQIPRNLHFDVGNPHVPWDALPIKVVSEPTDWKRSETRRIAGVSSFGFSGTNAHVILEEAPVATAYANGDRTQ